MTSWIKQAACGSMPTEMFTMNKTEDEEVDHLRNDEGAMDFRKLRKWNDEKVEKAQTVCAACPVRDSCISSAEPSDLYWTVRGGERPTILNPREVTGAKGRSPIADVDRYVEFKCPKGHVGDKYRVRYPNGKPKCTACAEENYLRSVGKAWSYPNT